MNKIHTEQWFNTQRKLHLLMLDAIKEAEDKVKKQLDLDTVSVMINVDTVLPKLEQESKEPGKFSAKIEVDYSISK